MGDESGEGATTDVSVGEPRGRHRRRSTAESSAGGRKALDVDGLIAELLSVKGAVTN